MTSREINAVVRHGGNGRNVYVTSQERRGKFRVTLARTPVGGTLQVKILVTGEWYIVKPGDKVEVSL